MYYGSCQNWKQVWDVFEFSKYKAPKQEPDILLCFVTEMDCEGNVYILYREKNSIMMVNTGWSSLDNPNWEPEEITAKTLRYILDEGTYFHEKLFEHLGYDINIKYPYGNYLTEADISVQAYLHLDNLLTTMGYPPNKYKIAAITGNSQTIYDIEKVFPNIKIDHMLETSLMRADADTIEQIRIICPDVVVLTLDEALIYGV